MRIGMLADVYKPHISGITNYIALNKQILEKLGHEVYVFTFGEEDDPDDEVNIIRSSGMPLRDTGYYISLRYSRAAAKLLRTMEIGHVHHPFLSGSLGLFHLRPRGIPVIFTNHTRYDLYAQAYLPGVPDFIGETALQTYLPSFCRACNLVVSPSAGMRDILVNMGVDAPIDVVPNGVDLRPFNNPGPPIDRAQFGFGPEDVILMYAGRLGPEKNLSFLINAYAGLAEAFPQVGLVLVGDGPERENLHALASGLSEQARVKFTGFVPYAQLPAYLAAADAFVTASVSEVHPLSVIEAMACGLPVLGIQSPGVGDTVRDGETGFIVSREDQAAFTAKMIRLATDAEERKQMGQQAQRAAEDYAIERTAQMMVDRYERVIEENAGRKTLRSRIEEIIGGWPG